MEKYSDVKEFIDNYKEKIADDFDNIEDYYLILRIGQMYREEKNKNIKQKEIVNQLINAIKTKLKNSDNYEMGVENSSYKDRLFTETYIELQVVLDKLKEVTDEI